VCGRVKLLREGFSSSGFTTPSTDGESRSKISVFLGVGVRVGQSRTVGHVLCLIPIWNEERKRGLSSSWFKDFSLFESTAETPNAVTTIWTHIKRRQVIGSDLMGTTADNSMAGRVKLWDIRTYRNTIINRSSLWKRAPQLGGAVTSGGPVAGTTTTTYTVRVAGKKENEIRRMCLFGDLEWGEEPLCLETLCRKKYRLAPEISMLHVCKLHIYN